MTDDQTIAEALEEARRRFPSDVAVASIEFEPYVDWTGDDALRVTVVLQDDETEGVLSGKSRLVLKRAIHDSLLARGVTLFPYVRTMTENERATL